MFKSILQKKSQEIDANILTSVLYDVNECIVKLRISLERARETSLINKNLINILMQDVYNEVKEINAH